MPRTMPSMSLQLLPPARAFLEARAVRTSKNRLNVSAPANVAIERYEAILAAGERAFLTDYSEAQRNLLCDILNGSLLTPDSIPHLWMEVADAEDAFFEGWGVDRAALVGMLKAAALHELYAIADWVERWWASQPKAGTDPQP